MVSIQIGDPKHFNNPRNVFIVTYEVVVGDGNEYRTFKLAPIYRSLGFETQLGEVIELLEAMKDFSWTEDNSYSDLRNYDKWLPAENPDPFLLNGFIATLNRYEISYYDHNGIERGVSIRK